VLLTRNIDLLIAIFLRIPPKTGENRPKNSEKTSKKSKNVKNRVNLRVSLIKPYNEFWENRQKCLISRKWHFFAIPTGNIAKKGHFRPPNPQFLWFLGPSDVKIGQKTCLLAYEGGGGGGGEGGYTPGDQILGPAEKKAGPKDKN